MRDLGNTVVVGDEDAMRERQHRVEPGAGAFSGQIMIWNPGRWLTGNQSRAIDVKSVHSATENVAVMVVLSGAELAAGKCICQISLES